jgi:hypothetical protein
MKSKEELAGDKPTSKQIQTHQDDQTSAELQELFLS